MRLDILSVEDFKAGGRIQNRSVCSKALRIFLTIMRNRKQICFDDIVISVLHDLKSELGLDILLD